MNYVSLYQAIQDYAESSEQLFVDNISTFVRQAEQRVYNAVQIPALRKNVTGTLTSGNQYLSAPSDYLSTYSLAIIDADNNYSYLLNKDVNFLREAYPSVVNTGGTYQGTPESVPKYYALFGSQYNNPNELSFILAPTPDDSYNVELHYFYYPASIVQGAIASGTIVSGSGYANNLYSNVPITGGSGNGATANITVAGNVVTSVRFNNQGNFYVAGDVLSAPTAYLGGVGSGFQFTVTATDNILGTSWLGDNYDPVLLYGALREAVIFQKGEADMVALYEKQFMDALMQLNRLGTGLERGDAYRDGQARIKQVNP